MKKFAIFFPQFYPVKVNNLAWGFGFTDWSLVIAANAFGYWKTRRSPLNGFYDLSKPEDIKAQFDLAHRSGLDGFGIYHYRFIDGPELDSIENYLRSHSCPNSFEYFLIWANEDWSKRWAGKKMEVLKSISKSPSRAQIKEHVNYLKPHLTNEKYAKYKGKPMFVFYRPDFFEDPLTVISTYREEFIFAGIEPAIGYFLKNKAEINYSETFDFCYLFEPRLFQNFSGLRQLFIVQLVFKKLALIFSYKTLENISSLVVNLLKKVSRPVTFSDYLKYFNSSKRKNFINQIKCPYQEILTCGWNNAPRYRDQFTELVPVPTSEEFASLLKSSISNGIDHQHLPILCNAWNEWSEGAAIEPCSYLGDSLLKIYINGEKKT